MRAILSEADSFAPCGSVVPSDGCLVDAHKGYSNDARIVGWDLAYSENGWVIVEGNAFGQLIGQQMCDKVGKKAEFEALMKQI